MHFWIDKRSQACGFSGRHRVPASLSAGCGQQRRRRSRGKPMVTPVHRFQPIECVGTGPRRGQHHRQLHNCLPPAYSGVTSPPGPVRPPGAHAVELDSSVFLDLPLDGTGDSVQHNNQLQPQLLPIGRLKCGMWASFGLATVFVAGAKFYFDQGAGAGLEVLVFCALLVVFLLAGCTVSLCRFKAARDLLSAAVTSHAPPSATSLQSPGQELEVVLSEETQPTPLPPPTTTSEPPPPPYHIAILLPQQARSHVLQGNDESPPPSYDKAVS